MKKATIWLFFLFIGCVCVVYMPYGTHKKQNISNQKDKKAWDGSAWGARHVHYNQHGIQSRSFTVDRVDNHHGAREYVLHHSTVWDSEHQLAVTRRAQDTFPVFSIVAATVYIDLKKKFLHTESGTRVCYLTNKKYQSIKNGCALSSTDAVMMITSRDAFFDWKMHVISFNKSVEVHHGNRLLNAKKLILHLDNKNQNLLFVEVFGNPAVYIEKKIIFQAEEMNIDVNKKILILKKHAKIFDQKNEISGHELRYDFKNDSLQSHAPLRSQPVVVTMRSSINELQF